MTDFETKCEILSDLWINYRDEQQLEDFIEYNDIGLQLAYCVHAGLSIITEQGSPYVGETFALLCSALGLDEDEEYRSLNDMLENASDEEELDEKGFLKLFDEEEE
jgi:hypothetical protein